MDGLGDAGIEVILRLPAEFGLNLLGIDGVAAVVTEPVFDVVDELLAFAKSAEDGFDDLEVAPLVMAADVIDLAIAALTDDQINCFAMVGDVEPVTDVLAIAINGEFFTMGGFLNHQGDELLGELIRPVVIGATRNGDWEAIGPVVGQNE